MIVLVMFLILLALICLNVPIAVGLAVAAIFGVGVSEGLDSIVTLALDMYDGSTKFSLIAIPMFVLAGAIMNAGGITDRLINFVNAIIGFVRGGLAMVNIGEPMPQKPTADHKQAFKVRLGNKELGLREFSSQSKLVISRFDVLHNAYEAGKADNPGKVPVVTIEKTETVTVNTPQGENRFKVPVWSITSWVDKPDILDGAAPPVAAPSAASPTTPAPAEIAVEPLF